MSKAPVLLLTRQAGSRAAMIVLWMLAICPSAYAGDAVVSEEAQLEQAEKIWRAATEVYLKPCIQRDNDTCHERAAALLNRLKTDGVTVTVWSRLVIRNNMYFYLVAPSLRLADAIVNRGNSCADWQTQAARAGTSLASLLTDAAVEVGGKMKLPEYKELQRVQERVRACAAQSGDE